MCGICGYIGRPASDEELVASVQRMTDAIVHRGPDDAGAWTHPDAGVALGFRRLAIVDLSPAGHQPMCSASGRWVLAFNGEIYNYESIRRELLDAGHDGRWRGHSDTEVMLAAVERWGVSRMLERVNGMFAFALWDREARTLYLSRDRVGEKPLYYGWVGDELLFGSELKSFYAHPRWRGEIDRDAVALYLRYSCVPAPHSIWRGIAKLPPGTVLTLPWGDGAPRRPHRIEPYWSAAAVATAARANPWRGSPAEAVDGLDTLLRDAVGMRMHADVPLGAFLSGGVDSSTIVALMQAQSSRPVQTFSIGFEDPQFDEAPFAAAVARHLGTDHTEMYVSPRQAMDVIPALPTMFDEPFADSSQIPTYLVSALARRHVTVSLSGDGGDEIFAGYNRHRLGRTIWRMLGPVPRAARAFAASGVERMPKASLERLLGRFVGGATRLRHGASSVSSYLRAPDRFSLYQRFASSWHEPSSLVLGGSEPPLAIADRSARGGFADFADEMSFLDLLSYLPDDILVKVDRASMAVSLEGRMPFLDHRVLEFAWRLPVSLKIRGGRGKWILRQVLDRYVPRALIDRPKTGFSVPLDAWLRGPLRDWAEALLDERAMSAHALLDPAPIRRVWSEQLAGVANRSTQLWAVLMLQAWLAERS